MQQQLQEFDFNVVHRAKPFQDARRRARLDARGEGEGIRVLPRAHVFRIGLTESKAAPSRTVTMISETQEEDEEETITWERTPSGISTLQKQDDAMSQVFYWAELEGDAGDMPSLGTNLIPKEQAIQYGPKALAYWSRWNELSIRGGCSIKKIS